MESCDEKTTMTVVKDVGHDFEFTALALDTYGRFRMVIICDQEEELRLSVDAVDECLL